ncbi:MAG: SulP family inorganic anion transporter [Beijerinckiaceae bacterium]
MAGDMKASREMTAEARAELDRFLPKIVTTFRAGYSSADARADALAGLTVAIVALPLSMAIAIASGLSPERGLFAAIVGGFLISLLGGSKFQIGGPAGAFIVLIYATVEKHGYEGLVLATCLAGIIMMLAGALRLGAAIRLIPPPVIAGFMTGIAIIIFASQIKELLGLDIAKEPAALLPKLAALWGSIGSLKPVTLVMSVACVAGIVLLRKARPAWPVFLIVVAVAAVLTALLNLDVTTIGSRFGSIPHGLPAPSVPVVTWEKIIAVLPEAMAIALLGCIESLLSAVVADSMSGDHHRANGELMAQGVANIATMLFGGMTVTGTIARTATNIKAGGRSPVSGMLHAVYLLVFMLVAAPLANHIPLAALGAMLAVVCWGMADHKTFIATLKSDRASAAMLLVTFVLTIFINLIAGLAAGLALAMLLSLFNRSARQDQLPR